MQGVIIENMTGVKTQMSCSNYLWGYCPRTVIRREKLEQLWQLEKLFLV